MASRTGIDGGNEVTLEFSQHIGPRYVHGAVTLLFDSNLPYEFVSTAVWPTSDNYESAIREGVEAVLLERIGRLSKTRVLLKRIAWNEVASCEIGFHRAAITATKVAFDV
jgi:hypothetical protein